MAPTILTKVLVPAAAMFGGGALDLVALAIVKDELNITTTADDVYLQRAITQASTFASTYCNRVFQPQTYQDQFYPQQDPYPWQVPGGLMPLQLAAFPVIKSTLAVEITAPPQPVLGQVIGGSLPATTYYSKITYITAQGESLASAETNYTATANNLLQVTSPPIDAAGEATGWNVYVSSRSGIETKQNASPIAIGTAWTQPTTGLIIGVPLPSVTVTEFGITLSPGTDYLVDEDKGQLTRMDMVGYPRHWSAMPIEVIYGAGYASIPADLQDAAIRLVKSRYFARLRDPGLRSETAPGVWQAQYWFASGPGSDAGMDPDTQAILDQYVVPVIG